MSQPERLQKILAKAGIASRRKCEELILEGVVTVNGKIAGLGDKATLGKDAIKVRGKLLQGVESPIYLAFYKPRNVISLLSDTENRASLSDYISKIRERVFPVGRLGYTAEGIILLTNDGDFTEKLQKRDDIPRVYHVKIKGHLNEEMIRRLQRGARIEHRMVKPYSVRVARELESKSQVEIVMMGSTSVDIRAMVEMKGFLVEKITRTAIGHLTVNGLPPGHFRVLTKSQVDALLEQPELGLKRLEREIEDAKPSGQRNVHAKKNVEAAAEGAAAPAAKPAARPAAARPKASPAKPRPGAKPAFGDKRPGSRPARPGSKPAFGDKRPGSTSRPSRRGSR